MRNERAFVTAAIKLIRKDYPEVWCWKVHDQFTSGIPDIVGCLGGVFFAIEAKQVKELGRRQGKTEAIQVYVMEQIKKAGGIVGVAKTLDDVRAIMKQVVDKGAI